MRVGIDLEDGIIMSFSSSRYLTIMFPVYLITTIILDVFEGTKGTNRIRKSKKNMLYNGQKKKDKNHLQNIHLKLKIE